MINPNIKLNTWLDTQECLIESRIHKKWPSNVFSVNCYWDQVFISHTGSDSTKIWTWLTETFSPRLLSEDGETSILLADDKTKIPVILAAIDTQDTTVKPLLRPSIASSSTIYKEYSKPAINDKPLKVQTIAFHSFKGGVGRTLHAVAMAKTLSDKGKKILLIDGDFEAPGISYLAKSSLVVDYSYADLLGAIHSDPSDVQRQAIDFAVKSLANQKIGNIFLLPSFRTDYQQRHFEIKPEHIIQNFDNGFILPEILAEIASGLAVDYIIVDLRAGLSELSTGLLLDPRIEKFIVSSINAQSLEGTKVLLDIIKNFSYSIDSLLPELTIVLNNISDFYLTNRSFIDEIKNELINSYFDEYSDSNVDVIYNIEFIESVFNSDLLTLNNNFEEYCQRLEKAGIGDRFNLSIKDEHSMVSPADLTTRRTLLRDNAEALIYAERGTADKILWTQPLKRVAESFNTKLPNVVISGAKGAGKTLIFTNLIKAKNWKAFLEKGGFASDINALMLPILKSASLSDVALSDLGAQNIEISKELILTPGSIDISSYIESMMINAHTSGEWTKIWIDAIAIASGFQSNGETSIGEQFISHLRNENKKAVALFDGLEDLFQNIDSNSNEYQKDALRSLIQRVPDYLAQLPNSPLGIIVLIRQDYIEYSITQNSAQFLDRYKIYQLKWNVDEALKLVWYVLNDLLPTPETKFDLHAHRSEVLSALLPLWGLKLGGTASKEAHSANWILTALSDWNGQIQARDLIRFLYASARDSVHQTSTDDRILAVSAVKAAVEECSTAKIAEIIQENLVLKEIFDELQKIADKKTPFSQTDFPLSLDKIKTLIDNGIVYKEVQKGAPEQYHIAEIYRHGLGFTYKGRKMTKMLAFRRAIES